MPTLRYIGHSTFELENEGTVALIDPFVTGCPTAAASTDELNPTVILVTHAHADHCGDAVSISQRTGATVITINELANYLGSKGAKTIGANHGGTVAFEGGTVKFTPAWHSSTIVDDEGNYVAAGVPAGLIVTMGDKKVYFAGDTCLFLDMQLIGEEELDVAVLPIGDHFTMGPADAVRAAKFLRAKAVVPCHYDTFPPIKQDPEAFKKDVEEKTSSKGVILAPGQSWTIE
jgi:L-ascorbate metabolism protein UlaG (beta-lactamase superfamily)